jgi:hypothetical protein
VKDVVITSGSATNGQNQILSPVADHHSFQELTVMEGFNRKFDRSHTLHVGVDAG